MQSTGRTLPSSHDEGLGLPWGMDRVNRVSVDSLRFPPEEVNSAFDDVARAQAGIRTRTNQAEQVAERRLREASSEAYRLEQLERPTNALRTQSGI